MQRHNQHKFDAQRENEKYKASEDGVGASIDATTGSLEAQIAKLGEKQAALLAGYDAMFAAIHADERARDALGAYGKAAGDANISQDELNRTLVTAEESALRAAVATGEKAIKDYQGSDAAEAHALSTQAQIDYLNDLMQTLAPDDPLRVFLQQYIDKLNSTPATVNTTVSVEDNASPTLDSIAGKLIRISQGALARVGVGQVPSLGFASGGWAKAGDLAWVGEDGPELIHFTQAAHVYSHPDSMQLMRNAASLAPYTPTSHASDPRDTPVVGVMNIHANDNPEVTADMVNRRIARAVARR